MVQEKKKYLWLISQVRQLGNHSRCARLLSVWGSRTCNQARQTKEGLNYYIT